MTIFKSPHLNLFNINKHCSQQCSQQCSVSDDQCSICFDNYSKLFNFYNKSNQIIYIKDIPNHKNKIILKRNYSFRNFLRDYLNNNPKTVLECKHYFHSECITKWYTQADSCPICRSEILLSNKLDILASGIRYQDECIDYLSSEDDDDGEYEAYVPPRVDLVQYRSHHNTRNQEERQRNYWQERHRAASLHPPLSEGWRVHPSSASTWIVYY